MHTFEIGKKYYARSTCDYDCIFFLTVKSRTEKTLVTSEGKRLKIYNFGDGESVYPNGRYSMAAVIDAKSIAA
jgi:hypothetical protein